MLTRQFHFNWVHFHLNHLAVELISGYIPICYHFVTLGWWKMKWSLILHSQNLVCCQSVEPSVDVINSHGIDLGFLINLSFVFHWFMYTNNCFVYAWSLSFCSFLVNRYIRSIYWLYVTIIGHLDNLKYIIVGNRRGLYYRTQNDCGGRFGIFIPCKNECMITFSVLRAVICQWHNILIKAYWLIIHHGKQNNYLSMS